MMKNIAEMRKEGRMMSNNTGDWNTGRSNTGDRNTGDKNTGHSNAGNGNTGDWNTGDRNIGNCNTGNCNEGHSNTGNCNEGHSNTGDWNATNNETGFFNTEGVKKIRVFNKECSISEWKNATKPSFLYFDLCKFIYEEDMTEEEKNDNPEYETTGSYLKVCEYKEAFQNSYNELSKEERERQVKQLKALPNFNEEVFYEISGIDIRKQEVKKMSVRELSEMLGYEIEIVKD